MKISEVYRRAARTWNIQAKTGEIKDEDNPLFIFSLIKTDLLEKIINGELDAAQLALLELEARRPRRRDYNIFFDSQEIPTQRIAFEDTWTLTNIQGSLAEQIPFQLIR